MGYLSGPAGIDVPKRGMYCVRPIYNLNGMGAGSYIQELLEKSDNYIPPGYFWCEFFEGTHYSIDWKYDNEWKPIFCCIGERNEDDPLYKFNKWKIADVPYEIDLPNFIKEIDDVKYINTEFIGNKLIEVHLRKSSDFPENAKELIPVWENEKEKFQHLLKDDWNFILNEDNSSGNLPETRVGFYYR